MTSLSKSNVRPTGFKRAMPSFFAVCQAMSEKIWRYAYQFNGSAIGTTFELGYSPVRSRIIHLSERS